MYKLEKNKITYFNNDVMIVYKKDFGFDVDCIIDDDGYKLLNAIPNLNSAEISGGVLLINGKTKIAILNATMPDFSGFVEHEVNIHSNALANAFKFIGDNFSRPVLKGVFVGETGTIMASDSYKLYAFDRGECKGIILTPELAKVLVEENTDFVLKYNNRFAWAEFENHSVYGRLIQGEFPSIFKLLEVKGNSYSFDYEKLKKSLEIGSLTKARIIEIGDHKIKFAGDVNTYVDDIDLDITVNLSFNSLKAALSVYNFNNLYFIDSGKPILFVNDNEKVLLIGMK